MSDVAGGFLALVETNPQPWVIIDHLLPGGTLYKTHHLCGTCCADLSELRVHHVVCCPYCGTDLPFLLDILEQEHLQFEGSWPYEALSARYLNWCRRINFNVGGAPDSIDADGTASWRGKPCRLLRDHAEPCRFDGPRQRPARNPIRGDVRRMKTADEFAREYAARSGVTVDWLREHGREARPCDCGDEMCEGWQMAHVNEGNTASDSDAPAYEQPSDRLLAVSAGFNWQPPRRDAVPNPTVGDGSGAAE